MPALLRWNLLNKSVLNIEVSAIPRPNSIYLFSYYNVEQNYIYTHSKKHLKYNLKNMYFIN